ncbi:MAG TPA: methyltransferase domain-containing protein [Polyangiaceae bacterium]
MPNIDDEPLRDSYRDVMTHKLMLQDVVRTTAYAEAIRTSVRPGQRVIDFGTGTGVLAIFAARAGASHVDAIERTSVIEHAKAIAQRNGHPAIAFHRGNHESFTSDAPADIIISEWMGHFVFYESMLQPLIALRERWLKPGGTMIPARVTLRAALVTDEGFFEDGSFLEHSPYGIDFGPIADLPLRQSRIVDVDEQQILSPYIDLGTIDMHSIRECPSQLHGSITVPYSTTVYGIVGWFDAMLTSEIELSTAPDQPLTHWRPIFFPLPQPFDCEPGRPVTVTIAPPQNVEVGEPTWAWRISDAEQTQQVDERETFARCRAEP